VWKHPKPWFSIITSAPRCFGLNGYAKAAMKDADPYTYIWDLAPQFKGDSLVAPVGNFYRLTAINKRTGCQSDTMVEIPGFKSIQAAFILNIQNGDRCISNIFPTLQVFNGSSGGTTGTWYWGDGSAEPYDPNGNPTHTYNGDINNYKLKLVIFNAGGCKDSTTANICFVDTVVVFIPNTFTPDGDGTNDIFLPSTSGSRRYEMMVYNRWGEIVFSTKNIGEGWDGNYKGYPCPEGVYAYKLIFKGKKTFSQTRNGSITLLRRK
jgi:gliding motility-associated-like protein